MILHTIVSVFGLMCLVSLVIIFGVFDYKETRLKTKARMLKELLDKDYETDKIDLNDYLK